MVQQLVKDMVDNEHPFEAEEDVVLDSVDETALNEVQFYVKTEGARASHDYRYHCSKEEDDEMVACGKLAVRDCTAVGAALPDPSVLCKQCAKARPDVASRCFSAQSGSVRA